MYKNLRKLLLLNILLYGTASAQQPLQLEEAISRMAQNNTQLKLQQKEVELSNSELNGTLTGFLPRVAASYTGMTTNDPLNSFGFKLQQRTVSQADFNPDLLNHPGGTGNFNTKFSLQQPILNFDIYSARKALREKIKATEYQKQFAQEMLAVEIRKSYTNLQFLYEAKDAVKKGISAYEEVLRNTRNMEQQGYAKSSDVLMVQVGLTEVENKEIEINNNISNISDYLTWLMGTSGNDIYIPTDTLSQSTSAELESDFSTNRLDMLAMRSGLEAQNEMVEMNRKKLLPRLNAFGEFNLYDKNMFGFSANSYLAGFSLSWDIFNGNETRNKIEQSKISVEKSKTEMQLYIEKKQLELQKAKRDLITNQAQITLARTAKEQAGQSLRILENRYSQGLEKTSDILVSQATDLSKQVGYLEAIKNYNLSLIDIRFLTQQPK